jgi:uncharacterized protein
MKGEKMVGKSRNNVTQIWYITPYNQIVKPLNLILHLRQSKIAKRTSPLPSALLPVVSRAKTAILLVGGTLSLSVLVAAALLFENAIRVPRKTGSLPESFAAELRRLSSRWDDVTVQSADGTNLRAWFFEPRAPSGACLTLLHGIADSRLSGAGFAPLFLNAGYAVLVPDIRAHGQSGGSSISYGIREKEDLRAWASWLQTQGCRDLYALGESMGGAIALQAAGAGVPFRAVVAECPFASFDRIAEYRLSDWPRPLVRALVPTALLYGRLRYGIDLYDASAEAALRHTATPVLLIHGLEDRSVPPENSRILAAVDPSAELWLVPGAGHTSASSAAPGEFTRRVLGFFAAHRGQQTGALR